MIIKKAYKENYTVVANTLINDERLDWCHLGLMCYLLSKPETWKPKTAHLIELRQTGRKPLLKMFTKLIDLGYVERNKRSDGNVEYWIYPEPKSQNGTQAKKPKSQNGTVPKRHPIVSKDILSTKDNKVSKERGRKRTRPIPLNPSHYFLDEELKQWAKENKWYRMEYRLEHFKCCAEARSAGYYTKIGWKGAFKKSVMENWAKIDNEPTSREQMEEQWERMEAENATSQ